MPAQSLRTPSTPLQEKQVLTGEGHRGAYVEESCRTGTGPDSNDGEIMEVMVIEMSDRIR